MAMAGDVRGADRERVSLPLRVLAERPLVGPPLRVRPRFAPFPFLSLPLPPLPFPKLTSLTILSGLEGRLTKPLLYFASASSPELNGWSNEKRDKVASFRTKTSFPLDQ